MTDTEQRLFNLGAKRLSAAGLTPQEEEELRYLKRKLELERAKGN